MNRLDYPSCGIALYRGVTKSGLNVFVFPREGYQTKYAFFATKYGGCDLRFQLDGNWTDTPAGIAHFLEHKMFDMPDHNVMERFTALGASPNAFTSNGMTGYLFSCAEHFDESLQELLTYVLTPYFTPESVAKEQGIIGQEIRMGEDSPGRRVQQNLHKALYRNHTVRESIAGTVESIAQISADTLTDCHRMFYRPENMVLCCAGDLDPEKVMVLAEELVTGPAGPAPARAYGEEEGPLPAQVRIEDKMTVSMPLFRMGAKLPWTENGRDWAKLLLTADLGCSLLMGENAPLYAELYAQGIINKSFYAGSYDFPGGGVCCAGGRCAEPMTVLGRVVDAAEAFQLDQSALARFDRLKKATLGNFLMALDSLDDLCHTQADGYFNGWERMEFPALCEKISPQDVARFIQDTFRAERLAISIVNPL